MDKLEYIPGDLVIYASLIKEPVAEICEVHEASYTVKFMHGNFEATSKEIKPIPLTHEILEKNGWSKGQIYFRNSRIPRIKLCTYDGISWSVSINNDIIGSYINYVHQLQHILFAFDIGEEMEV